MPTVSFGRFWAFTRYMPVELRIELFLGFPENMQREMWDELERDCRARRIYEHESQEWEECCLGVDGVKRPEYRDIRAKLRPKPEPPPFMEHLSRSIDKRQAIDDHLLTITTQEYVERIAHVSADRKVIYCPLPDHDDSRTPNFYLYEHNWRCYACGAQGRIYQFAALMWGYTLPLRGRAFNEVFERLSAVFRLDTPTPKPRP